MFTIQDLNSEIVSDPNTIGYKAGANWKGDQIIAGLLNAVIVGNTITRLRIEPQEITSSIVLSEISQLSVDERWFLDNLLNSGQYIDATDSNIFASLTAIFSQANMPDSRALLLAKIQRNGSRAEKLWGEGATINAGNIGQAAKIGA